MGLHLGRCGFFWLWAGVGAALLVSTISFIGVLTALPAVVALVLVARRSPRWPEPLGLLAGLGALCLTVGALHLGEAGGFDPAPWLAAGAGLAVIGVGGYELALRSRAAGPR